MSDLLIVAILTAITSTGVATIVVKLLERRKTAAETDHVVALTIHTEAESTDLLTQAGVRTVKLLQEQLERAFVRIAQLEEREAQKDARIIELEHQVVALKQQVRTLEFGT